MDDTPAYDSESLGALPISNARTRQVALALLATGDRALAPAGAAAYKGALEQELEARQAMRQQAAFTQADTIQSRNEAYRELMQQRALDAAENRADSRASMMLGRWQLKKIPTQDGFKYVQQNNLTGEIRDPPVNLNQDATVGPKAKQDAAALEAAANRVEALSKTATPDMFSVGGDALKQMVSGLPLVGGVAQNLVKSGFSPEHKQFLEQETAANALVRRALEGGVGTDESRQIMQDAYPYTPGVSFEQFQQNAPAFVEQLRGMARAKRGANYNPDTGTGGIAPQPMRGVPPGGIPPYSSASGAAPTGSTPTTSGLSPSAGEHWTIGDDGKPARIR